MTSWRGVGPDIQAATVERIIARHLVTRSVESWASVVAGRVGVTPPNGDFDRWLRLRRDMAAACMTSVEFGLLSQEMGWDT